MREYIKIETPFERATDGSKKLIEGQWRNESAEFLKDNQWIWTEKVDGTNTRICWDGHRVTFGAASDGGAIPARLVNYLNSMFYTNEAEELFEQKFGESSVILFGEGYGQGIQGSMYGSDFVSFILFDVLVGNTWIKREGVEDIARAFGIDVVPIIGTGTIAEAIEYVKTKPESTLKAGVKMEGLVIRPAVEMRDRLGNRLILKIKSRDF